MGECAAHTNAHLDLCGECDRQALQLHDALAHKDGDHDGEDDVGANDGRDDVREVQLNPRGRYMQQQVK